MSNPGKKSINAMMKDYNYTFVGTQDVPVWPGSQTRYIFACGDEYWATNMNYDEDGTAWMTKDTPVDWFRVHKKTKIVFDDRE